MNSLQTISRFAIYALLIFTPLAAGAVQGWAITLIHLVTLAALTTLLLQKAWTWDWKWISTPLDKPFIALLILVILSTIFSMHRRTSVWSLILLVNYLVLYYLVVHTVQTRSQLRHLVYVIISVAVFLSVFGLMKKLGNNPFPWWDYPHSGLNPDLASSSSTYVNPNHFAGYMEMAIPVTLGLFLLGYRGSEIVLMSSFVVIMVTAFILCLSRGGWAGEVVGLSFMSGALLASKHTKRKKLLLAFIAGTLVVAFLIVANRPVIKEIQTLSERTNEPSLHSRVLVWGEILDMIRDHTSLGTGPGTFSTIFTQYQPPGLNVRFTMGHNDYLHFISETGVALAAIFLWMIIVFYKKGVDKLRHPSRLVRGTTLGAMAGITAILFHSIFDFNLHIPANAMLFTVLAAVAMSPIPKPDKIIAPDN